jgi:catechol 2,3-dioxygenase-like lactoylglutathione lyase family enzyme
MLSSAIPILYSGDLAVSEEFYAGLGFEVTARFEGYLVTNAGPVEVHLSSPDPGTDPDTDGTQPPYEAGSCFVHVVDAVEYHKQLTERGVPGLSAPQQQDYGLVEFAVLDPFGNRLRFGSPTS